MFSITLTSFPYIGGKTNSNFTIYTGELNI